MAGIGYPIDPNAQASAAANAASYGGYPIAGYGMTPSYPGGSPTAGYAVPPAMPSPGYGGYPTVSYGAPSPTYGGYPGAGGPMPAAMPAWMGGMTGPQDPAQVQMLMAYLQQYSQLANMGAGLPNMSGLGAGYQANPSLPPDAQAYALRLRQQQGQAGIQQGAPPPTGPTTTQTSGAQTPTPAASPAATPAPKPAKKANSNFGTFGQPMQSTKTTTPKSTTIGTPSTTNSRFNFGSFGQGRMM